MVLLKGFIAATRRLTEGFRSPEPERLPVVATSTSTSAQGKLAFSADAFNEGAVSKPLASLVDQRRTLGLDAPRTRTAARALSVASLVEQQASTKDANRLILALVNVAQAFEDRPAAPSRSDAVQGLETAMFPYDQLLPLPGTLRADLNALRVIARYDLTHG